MRPLELTMSGLTSFTDRVTVDFDGATLFALVGPTGAGKSSVVDAMTLALYGRIPRLHANEIAPVISTAASECTVALTFTVRGQRYRAVRTIRRTKTGANTVEAVLDQVTDDDQVAATLAGTADDVTTQVESVIGLSFDEFTRAVVLPQGAFARVLKAKASERQSLLARLLGTGIYDRVKQRAGAHGRAADQRAVQTAQQIAQLGGVDEAQVELVEKRVAALDDLVTSLTADTQSLLDIRERFRAAKAEAEQARERTKRLAAITAPPKEVTELAARISTADTEMASATASLQSAETDVSTAEEASGDPAMVDELTTLIALHGRSADLTTALTEAEAALPPLRELIETLDAGLTTATAEAEQAAKAQTQVHRDHAAVQAVDGLDVGQGCPVCAATLTDTAPALLLDPADGQAAVAAAAQDVAAAIAERTAITTRLGRAKTDLEQGKANRDRAKERLSAHLATLEGRPSAAQAGEQLEQARAVQARIGTLRAAARAARQAVATIEVGRDRLKEQSRGLAQRLDRLRMGVADLGPPVLTDQVALDWKTLHEWAAGQLPAATMRASETDQAVDAAEAEGRTLRSTMDAACAEADVPPGAGDPRDRAVQARADAAAEVGRLRTVAGMVASLALEEQDAREQAVVGNELARLLRADQFQKWLLDEATRALVTGASQQLRELSTGRYELNLDGRGAIQVVDLASAGMTRSVRTLSGGETFLASLALALSLAEQIALSSAGPVALESLFIDEGFGALDAETLDTAAGAIEQLGAGERTVGVITHVADMADRLPTRFVVSRTASGSRVKRVDS